MQPANPYQQRLLSGSWAAVSVGREPLAEMKF
jgi:hypothetical protein